MMTTIPRPGQCVARAQRVLAVALWVALVGVLVGCNLNTGPAGGLISGPPVVQIVSPAPNAVFQAGIGVTIMALVSNAGADIDRVEIRANDQIVETVPTPNSAGAASFSLTSTWQPPAAGAYTLAVLAFRADASSSAPASVTINIISAQPTAGDQATTAPADDGAAQSAPTNTPGGAANPPATATTAPPTAVPATATVAASPTPSRPQATTRQGIFVRAGPSTLFNPPIGSFAAATTTDVLARNPAGDWYKVRYFNGEGWVFAQLVDVSGDLSGLPVENGPPVPTLTPVLPTAIPATPVPPTAASNINLVAGLIRIDPSPANCGQTFTVSVDVANFGTSPVSGGSILITDVRAADGSEQGRTFGAFGTIQPGQTVNSGPIPLTISTFYEEDHRIVAVIDNNNAVPETNENDNRGEQPYRLLKAGCP